MCVCAQEGVCVCGVCVWVRACVRAGGRAGGRAGARARACVGGWVGVCVCALEGKTQGLTDVTPHIACMQPYLIQAHQRGN